MFCDTDSRARPQVDLTSAKGHSRRSDGQQGFAECPLCLQSPIEAARRNESTRWANTGREQVPPTICADFDRSDGLPV